MCVEPRLAGRENKTGAPWPHQAVTKGTERRDWGVPEGGLVTQGRQGAGMEVAAETEMGRVREVKSVEFAEWLDVMYWEGIKKKIRHSPQA